MTNTHSQREEIRAPNADAAAHTFASSLQGLLDVTHELLQVADEAMYSAKRTGTGIEVAA